ncbi:NADH:ubiquinone reductase (Na(+)-transporting) subunit F [Psychroflexus gondwanensis]|jgi:Na+-transporting NADH:ubiquinone oxidoreductase subunit F|uniref:Na(+)-translocating NADH-quinone reductase subunit F n=1 Tax=Psychroflexus gondwanensis ACAM 44 TaxID=1189619 RepID=N1WXN2_9FLAO|nr:NADH:ubiquinone reductase (Na(+)-transporting) subunit F [Psychroflexus gondwanensis]EMY81947.1 Na(+)-translocating NADH-quinone reductase subunit F [Psychroflexus gondwanensis ACAM 44]TXE20434.1 NADH:ubiquinone reductase (Na(+)-transporting) subunit F [Psychroflexus gondwanensis]
MTVILASVAVFLTLILLLVVILLSAKAKLSPSGPVKVNINGEKDLEVGSGSTLLNTLSDNKLFLPSACGGGGTCIQCKCIVTEGGGAILPTEEPHFTRKEIAEGWRLGCQVKVKQDMTIQIPEEVFGIKKWQATVVSNYNVASFIKEFIVEIPEDMGYKAGGYIQIEIPACEVKFEDMDIAAHPEEHPDEVDKFKAEWDSFKLWPLVMKNTETVERAYSMASYPAEGRKVMLNVRIATPPFDRAKGDWMDVNPGVASSFIFGCKAGDKVTISGPYGEFFINESEAEMLYVGGGAGMAPMRSHLYHLFRTIKTGRKVTFWYGGRSKRELFYTEHFRALERDYPNFKFYLALSEPQEEDNWKVKDGIDGEGDGFVGFIHQCVIDNYLDHHEEPEDMELYFCGPPLMNQAVQKMGEDYGIPDENIRFDDFGG